MLKTPNIHEFKAWAKATQPAAQAVCMAMAFAQCERERVDAYIRPVFDSYEFQYGPMARGLSGRIPDPKHLYLCDDEPGIAAYYEDCDKAHRAHGFTGKHGHCPALIAEHLLIIAENALIKLAEPLFGVEVHDLGLDNRKKYLDLMLGACLIKEKKAA